MTLAACVLSFNHPEITARCIRSTLRFYEPERVFVLHNGSRPEFVEKLEKEFPELFHIKLESNRGFSGGANFALNHIFQKFDWCFFITNDCELIRVGPTPQVPSLQAPHIHFRKAGRTDSIGGQVFMNKAHLRHVKTAEEFSSIPSGQMYVPGTAFLMHKKIFAETLGFDESFHTYWEDVDLSLRVQDRNLPILYNCGYELIHSVGKTCHKDSFYTAYLFHRNRARLSRNRVRWNDHLGLPRAQLEVTLLVNCLSYAGRFLRHKKWENAKNVVRAYYGD